MALRSRREEPALPPAADPGPTRNERIREVKGLLSAYWSGVKAPTCDAVTAALRPFSREEVELFGASIPMGTGTTGARCERLRQLVAGVLKEKA